MKQTEEQYANELIEKYEEITKYGRWYDKILCAIQDVENTIEALDEIWFSHCDDNNLPELKSYYQNVLQILKDKL